MKKFAAFLGTASLALSLPATPAHAGGGDITNFKVRNCSEERIFVCSFDKTDNLLTIPYDALGIKPSAVKEFGCASLNRCKVIIGVSRKKTQETLSPVVNDALQAGLIVSGVSGAAAGLAVASAVAGGTAAAPVAVVIAVGSAIIAVAAGGAIAGVEIADGWKDGDVCKAVRKAAQKAGMKPKTFMKDGYTYRVSERYATDENGNPYVNPDGTAVIAYTTEKQRGA